MRLAPVLGLTLLLIGCHNPKAELVPGGSPSMWPKDFATSVADLPDEEHRLFLRFVARRSLDSVLDIAAAQQTPLTVGDAIVQERRILAASRRRAAKADARLAPVRARSGAQVLRTRMSAAALFGERSHDTDAAATFTPRANVSVLVAGPAPIAIRSVEQPMLFGAVLDDPIVPEVMAVKDHPAPGEHQTGPAYEISLDIFTDGQAVSDRVR